MKKILFALCIFCTLLAHGQFAKPTDAVSIPSYQMYRTPADSGVHIFMGNTLLWNSFWMKADTVKTNKSLVTKYYFKTHGPTVVTDNSTNAALYPVFTSATSGSYSSKVSTGLQFNPYYGNLALGGVYQGAAISVTNYLQITSTPKIYLASDPGSAGQIMVSGGSGGALTWSGGNATLGSYSMTADNFTLSDTTLKCNFKPIPIEKFSKIQFFQYNKKTDLSKVHYGVKAQEIQKVLPELINKEPDGKLSVAYVEMMIGKIAELEARIKVLEQTTKKKNVWKAQQAIISTP